jgi:transposase
MVIIDIDEQEYLAHYGILRKSGRYPWGSGEDQNTRNKSFLDHVEGLKKQGLTETEICKGLGIPSTTALRVAKSIAKAQLKQSNISQAQRLRDKGWSNVAIGERMGVSESVVRSWLAPGARERADILFTTSNMLKDQIAEKKYIDIGIGVENYLGISKERLNTAVGILREEGYEVHSVKVRQLGTGHETELKILAPPGTTQREVWLNRDQIKQITVYSDDGGRTITEPTPPLAISPKRIGIVYGDQGGSKADGVIFVRPGVADVSLGNSRYAQVRIKVGEGHYLKGMAMYKDDLPDGVDLLFNTNKKDSGNPLDAMKELGADPENPFGALIRRQIDGSSMNIVNEEGDWTDWSKTIASQVLSKQSPVLARTQLNMTYDNRSREYDELTRLTNPVVKKRLLNDFADGTDSDAVHLKAAQLPRQGWHAILPVNSLPATQVYAPNFNNGETVALIRYPHGGTFEIPNLTVNNNHSESKRLLGPNPRDAIGINHKVAERLSGADFDGDTVLVIPNNAGKIKVTPALEGLKNFDPKTAYPPYHGMKTIDGGTWNDTTKKVEYGPGGPRPQRKQQEMGNVSNLITDMTIRKASTSEIAAAVRHSMVVIDSEKHSLNWRESAIANGIPALKEQYQGSKRAGASTLISKAGAKVFVPERKPRPVSEGGSINPVTGAKEFVPTQRMIRDTRTGELRLRTQRSRALAEESDAFALSSGTPMERLYAEHSNKLKGLANRARLDILATPNSKYSPSAKKVYATEVQSLDAKLSLARRNAPLERQAQLIANTMIKAKRDDNPNMSEETYAKIKFIALRDARRRTGADKQAIRITDEEWEAIQAGAISASKLDQILAHADMERVRELATPRTLNSMTPAKIQRAQAMFANGQSRAEVAAQLGVSLSTLDRGMAE